MSAAFRSLHRRTVAREVFLIFLAAILGLGARTAIAAWSPIAWSTLPGERPAIIWQGTGQYVASDKGVTLAIPRILIGERHTTLFYVLAGPSVNVRPRLAPSQIILLDDRGHGSGATRITELESLPGVSFGVVTFGSYQVGGSSLSLYVPSLSVEDLRSARVDTLPGAWTIRFVENRQPQRAQIGLDVLQGLGSTTHHGATVAHDATGAFLGGPQQVATFKFDLNQPQPHSVYVLVTADGQVSRIAEQEYRDAIQRYR